MYYYLKGKPVIKGINYVVIDVHGVGYMVTVSANTLNGIYDNNKEVTIYTHFIVREDSQELFGFLTLEERDIFEMLISVSGVGPKAAISILSAATPTEFAAAIMRDDSKVITKAQGVGPKLAKRIILELRDKIKNVDLDLSDVPESSAPTEVGTERADAISALVALGYSNDDAAKAVNSVEGDFTTEELIKKALIRFM